MINNDIDTADRIILPFTFDVDKMIEEVEKIDVSNFVFYNVLPLRSPAHIVDTTLPFPPPVDDYADGSWTDWLNTKQLDNSPYLTSVIDFFQKNTSVTLVRLLRLDAGATGDVHTDPTLGFQVEKSVIRLTIPIINLITASEKISSGDLNAKVAQIETNEEFKKLN